MEHDKERDGKSTQQVPSTYISSQNMEGSINMANAFNNFFLRTTKELNVNICIRSRRKMLCNFFKKYISWELP
jgi:hypothetical protein